MIHAEKGTGLRHHSTRTREDRNLQEASLVCSDPEVTPRNHTVHRVHGPEHRKAEWLRLALTTADEA